MSGDDDMMDHEDPVTDDLDASEEFFEEDSFDSDETESADGEEPEDWESYDGEFTTDEGEGADALVIKKKKSTRLIVIIGAAVIGFGVLLMTMANNQPANQPSNNANTGALPGVVDNTPQFSSTSVEVGKQAPAGLLNDPEALKNLPKTIENASVTQAADGTPVVPQVNPDATVPSVAPPAPVAPPAEPVAVPAPDAVAPPMPASASPAPAQPAEALTPMPAQPTEGGLTAPMPEQAQAPAQPEAPIAAAPAEQPAPVVATPSEPTKAEPAKTAKEGFTVAPVMTSNPANDQALDAKLGQVLDRVNAVEAKLAETQKQPAGADIEAIQQTLAQINSRLDKMEAQGAAVVPVTAKSEPAAVEKPAVAKPRKAPRAPAAAAAVHAEKSAARWILKSAQPGQAYVSRPGQADMISVHAGDTLPGIGRVTAIDTEGGRWVIHGTQGNISQ